MNMLIMLGINWLATWVKRQAGTEINVDALETDLINVVQKHAATAPPKA